MDDETITSTNEPATGNSAGVENVQHYAAPESIYEAQPVPQNDPSPPPNELIPETVPENVTTEGIGPPPEGIPPVYEESKSKYVVIGVGVIIFLVLFFVIVRVLLGLGGKKESTKKITLKYWGLWEERHVYEPLIADYTRKNPNVSIIYSKIDPKNYRQKLLARNEQTEDRPDIFRFHNTWLPSIRAVASPLPKSVMSKSEYEKTFYPIVQTDLKVGNEYYGIPLEIDGLVLVYNAKLFKAAGIEAAPVTWEDIIDDAAKLSVKDEMGRIFTSGIALGTATNIEHFSDILGWMILQNGGSLKNLSAPEAVGALQQYRSFAEPPSNLWDEHQSNSIAAFISEQVAMIIVPSWELLTIKQANPDLQVKVTALPVVPGGKQITLASYWVEGVSKYSKNQIAAWKFLAFLVEKENLTKFYAETAKSRPFGEPYSRVDLGQTLVQNEYIGSIISEAKNMSSLPTISRTYDGGLNDEIVKYLEDAVNATAKGASYQDAFITASRGVAQVFNKFGIQ